MESQELEELGEKARSREDRVIGLTMAIVAAVLAVVTLMGHRLHTDEVVAQTKAADGWAYYQAKNGRYHLYSTDAELARLVGDRGTRVAESWAKKAEEERHDADEIRKENEERDKETATLARRATYFDIAEICLEVAIVLCSVSLLTGTPLFWRISFIGTFAGLVVAALGVVRG